jgi:hypothetical protein
MTMLKNIRNYKAPVIVGGVGGSGTRLIADILMELGYYIGSDLNESLDNLAVTLLFKRPLWYKKNIACIESHVRRGLNILTRTVADQKPIMLNLYEIQYVINAALDMYRHGRDHLGNSKGRWVVQRAVNVIKPKNPNLARFTGWGWKEPNSHIYLSFLQHYYSDIKYVHVIRNGLDMAYSSNQAQLRNWGFIWGIDQARIEQNPQWASLEYWIQANHQAINVGRTMGSGKFMVLNYDQLCESPEEGLLRLFSFLEVNPANVDLDHYSGKIKMPKTTGRYRQFDWNVFEKRQVGCVRELGFSV